MKSPATQRDESLDYLRGLLIFLVLWGHLIQYLGYGGDVERYYDDPIFKAIYMFHMPLFMLLSGYLSFQSMGEAGLFVYLRKRFRQILLPGISWPLLGLSGFLLAIHLAHPEMDWRALFHEARVNFGPGVWFLWALFGSTLIVSCLRKFGLDRLEYFALATALLLLAPDAACIYLFKYTFPFFCLGYALKGRRQIRLPQKTSWFTGLSLCAASAVCYFLWNHDTYIYTTRMHLSGNWGNISLRWLAGVIASGAFTFVALKIYRPQKFGALAFWGSRSIDIYLIHDYVLAGLIKYVPPVKSPLVFNLTVALLLAVVLGYSAILVGCAIRRTPVLKTVLLGK